jgi:hypothetical protein
MIINLLPHNVTNQIKLTQVDFLYKNLNTLLKHYRHLEVSSLAKLRFLKRIELVYNPIKRRKPNVMT